jgi:hypothetical protein
MVECFDILVHFDSKTILVLDVVCFLYMTGVHMSIRLFVLSHR